MKYTKLHIITLVMAATLPTACTHDIPMVNLGIDDTYYVARMEKLSLESALTGDEYQWILHRDDAPDSMLSTSNKCISKTFNEIIYIL